MLVVCNCCRGEGFLKNGNACPQCLISATHEELGGSGYIRRDGHPASCDEVIAWIIANSRAQRN
jgi:hypothetical protein